MQRRCTIAEKYECKCLQIFNCVDKDHSRLVTDRVPKMWGFGSGVEKWIFKAFHHFFAKFLVYLMILQAGAHQDTLKLLKNHQAINAKNLANK